MSSRYIKKRKVEDQEKRKAERKKKKREKEEAVKNKEWWLNNHQCADCWAPYSCEAKDQEFHTTQSCGAIISKKSEIVYLCEKCRGLYFFSI
jgi:arginyl-tRNA--protein-N-Asp/Glu arginylyltransferase